MAPDYPARIGAYHVLGVIGTGKLGTVYRAYDEAQARVVALRVLSRELLTDAPRLERFRRESQALSALSHPNIVATLDNGKDGDLTYLVMEYVDGSSLVDRVRSARPTLNECVQIIREVALGLSAAHAKGIVHGDIVPRNILVSRDLSVVKIVDFGTDVHGAVPPSAGTVTNARLGALLYRAPELLLNQSAADNRSDIYSLGVIAYEILTGRMPVGKFSLPSAANQQVPLDLDPVILRCLSSDPAHRYQSVNGFLSDLDKVRDVADYQVISELKQLTGGRRSKKATDLFTEKRSRTPLYIGLARAPGRDSCGCRGNADARRRQWIDVDDARAANSDAGTCARARGTGTRSGRAASGSASGRTSTATRGSTAATGDVCATSGERAGDGSCCDQDPATGDSRAVDEGSDAGSGHRPSRRKPRLLRAVPAVARSRRSRGGAVHRSQDVPEQSEYRRRAEAAGGDWRLVSADLVVRAGNERQDQARRRRELEGIRRCVRRNRPGVAADPPASGAARGEASNQRSDALVDGGEVRRLEAVPARRRRLFAARHACSPTRDSMPGSRRASCSSAG